MCELLFESVCTRLLTCARFSPCTYVQLKGSAVKLKSMKATATNKKRKNGTLFRLRVHTRAYRVIYWIYQCKAYVTRVGAAGYANGRGGCYVTCAAQKEVDREREGSGVECDKLPIFVRRYQHTRALVTLR